MNKLSTIFILTFFFCFLVFSRATAQLSLTLSTDKTTFQLGEPLVVNVELKNNGNSAVNVIKHLEPDYQFTSYTITKPDDKTTPYGPVTILNIRQNLTTTLSPGKSLFGRAKIFFGNKGWLFDKPGNYKIKAIHTSLEGNHVSSNELTIEIQSPPDEPTRRAAELMLTGPAGLFLLWEGGDQLTEGIAALEKVVKELPETLHAVYANFALGKNLSRDQGERKADLEKATIYLERSHKLTKEKVPTDYVRSKLLMELSDIYEKEGKKEKQKEIRRIFREEFRDKKQFQRELQKIEGER